MNFLFWHYSEGLQFYVQNWLYSFDWIIHFFSLPLLLKTLFSPWKRLVLADDKPGFNFSDFFQRLTFNLISRGVGATVRTILFFVGIILVILSFIGGVLALFLWLAFPPAGVLVYLKQQKKPQIFARKLLDKIKREPADYLNTLFDNEAGKFVLTHTGLDLKVLIEAKEKDFSPSDKAESYKGLLEEVVKQNVWPKSYFEEKGLSGEDLILASYWWDKKRTEEIGLDKRYFARPGLGLELVFGYTPSLNQFSIDLSIPQSFSHRLIGREQVVSRMERALTGGSSVMLTGEAGVGKRTVTLEFAHRAASGQLGRALSFKRVLEFDYNFLLSEATDLNQKKSKLSSILKEAASAGNIILVIRDLFRLTNSEVEGLDFTDLFEQHLEAKNLKIISVSTSSDYERFLARNSRLKKFFETVEITPPNMEEAMLILIESAQRWEKLKGMVITIPALRAILDGSDKYITDVPFPEKAIEILDSAVIYAETVGGNTIGVAEINSVLSEKVGVAFSHLTESEKVRLTNLEEIIHKRLINQDTAVEFIAKTLRAKQTGVVDVKRPIGSFLFMGPTGVGKTETAKVLANVYYGSPEEIIRIDMAEYAGSEGLERLMGSVSKNLPGYLTTSIKKHPASLLLLDEIEKATADVTNLLLTLLDEGFITDSFGKKIICRHLFVIATSNAAAEYVRQMVSKGMQGDELQKMILEHIMQTGIFSPEFLNRFDGVIVYEPLREEYLIKIAHLLLLDLAENLKKKNIHLEVTDEVAQKIAKDGYNPAQGARPMRRIIEIDVGDLLGRGLLAGELKSGDKIKIIPGAAKNEYNWEKVS